MDNKPLRYFDAVARHNSFTKAAEELHIAQPAISMAIKKLEVSFSLQLFHREDRKVSLTDEGRIFWQHCLKILNTVDDANQAMAELNNLTKGEVRVGIPSMLGSYYFPATLVAFRKAFPSLTLSVIEAGTWEIQKMLLSGELDLGVIVVEDTPESLAYHHLLDAEIRVTVSSKHHFASRKSITPCQFLKEPLVMFKEGYFHRKVVDAMAQTTNCPPNIVFETNLIPLIKEVVRQEQAITTLLAMVIKDETNLHGIPFSPAKWLKLGIAWRKGAYISKANQAFLSFLLASHNQQNTSAETDSKA
ncbi:MAG: LysR family transcriptional regulator [Pontibacterium sp.]